MTVPLADLFAKKFIARRDAKAIQRRTGEYNPVRVSKEDRTTIPWTRADLDDHIAGRKSFGHYLIDPANQKCKLFVLDIDLKDSDCIFEFTQDDGTEVRVSGNPRKLWKSRQQQVRPHIKHQLRESSHRLASAINKELKIPVAVAYSGNKGVHVYGFTGLYAAREVFAAAEIALKADGKWKPAHGKNFFDSELYNLIDLEIYPKQETVKPESFGNLVRLPLGRNFKSENDASFFVDLRSPMNQLVPRDSVEALTINNPWKD